MSVKISITKTVDRVPSLELAMVRLTRDQVLVGVPGEKAERGDGDTHLNNAARAYIHDNGAPEANIPARPFMRPGIDNAREQIEDALKAGALKALDGNARGVGQAQHTAGMAAARAIQQKISDGPFVPLAPRTIADRTQRDLATRRGKNDGSPTSITPLIDTGKMREAITYAIRRKGEG